jgi:hypothetical protein
MAEKSMAAAGRSVVGLREELLARGFTLEIVEAMLKAAGPATSDDDMHDYGLSPARLEAAQEHAVTVALAASQARTRIQDLVERTDPNSELGSLYRDKYLSALLYSRVTLAIHGASQQQEKVDSLPTPVVNVEAMQSMARSHRRRRSSFASTP